MTADPRAGRSDRCRVCSNASGNRRFRAREMMFGTRAEFEYFECAACGCLQLASPPPDLARYYPPGYYSLAEQNGAESGVRARLSAVRLAHLLGDRSIVGGLLTASHGAPPEIAALARLRIPRDAAILDVGCGRGRLLRKLAAVGFSHVRGVDAFIPADIDYPDGVTVARAALESIEGSYDIVMLHHALEHMPDPHAAMAAVRRLLAPTGVAIVRVPLADSVARRTYGAHWVQLDAPRHLLVPTRRGMCILADRARLSITDVVYDSTAFQFWGSELYQQDLPLHQPSKQGLGAVSKAPRRRVRQLERAARDLNAQEQGDQACFYLSKTALDG